MASGLGAAGGIQIVTVTERWRRLFAACVVMTGHNEEEAEVLELSQGNSDNNSEVEKAAFFYGSGWTMVDDPYSMTNCPQLHLLDKYNDTTSLNEEENHQILALSFISLLDA